MSELYKQNCEACRADAPKIPEQELKDLILQIPDWTIEVRDGIMQLEREFTFNNFKNAIEFTNKVGDIAEQEGHQVRQVLHGNPSVQDLP